MDLVESEERAQNMTAILRHVSVELASEECGQRTSIWINHNTAFDRPGPATRGSY